MVTSDKTSTMVSYGKVEPITTAPRPYTRLVNALKTNHSNLAPLARVLNQPTDDGLAAVIKFYDNGAVEERFLGSSHLDDFLHTPKDCARQLFLLQGVPPNYVEILGFKFNIDPNFFARHIHSGMPVQSYLGMRDIPLLASHPTSRESFCMRYHELRAFADPISDWELRAIDQPRRVSVSKFNGDFDGIGIARKNASVWFRETEDGKGWNAIILVDPPVGDQFYVGREKKQCTLRSVLYRGGYVDFAPPRDNFDLTHTARTGPRRENAFEDLIYYYTRVEGPQKLDYSTPVAVTSILKRYIASHWMIQLRYSLDLLVKYENTYHRACFFASVSSTLIQNSLRDVQHLNDRVAGWCEQVDRSIGSFKASGSLGSFPGQQGNDPVEDDFIHMLHQLRELKSRVQNVITSMTGLIGIIETMRMKELSLLAMVFIPLSLSTGLFSMQGEYAPGKSAFWIYCVVGLSLVLVVFLVAFGLNPGTTLIKMWKLKQQTSKRISRLNMSNEHDEEAG